MTCTVDRRRACSRAAAAVECRDPVLHVDVLEPAYSQFDTWTLEVTLAARSVPPAVLRGLADHGLSIRDASPRGGAFYAAAVVE